MAGFENRVLPGDTYRTHDGCLPVELSHSQHLCHGVSAAMTAKRPQGGDAAQRVTYQVISDGASRA
jgi:hypothetical protein